jgi:hypothetical protein
LSALRDWTTKTIQLLCLEIIKKHFVDDEAPLP